MLAYDPGIGAGYDVTLTILSLLIAILLTGAGLTAALGDFGQKTAAVIGGAIVGGGVAAMHFTGMLALEVPARITWSPDLVMASIALGIVCAAFALYVAVQPDARGRTLIATALLNSCHCFHALHGHERDAAGAGPDPRNRLAILVANFSFARRCRSSGHYSRHVFCRGNRR